jgi:hypothetical protein
LFEQYTSTTRGGSAQAFSPTQLENMFGIESVGGNPRIGVTIKLAQEAQDSDAIARLKKEGVSIYFRLGDNVFADVPVRALERVARQESVSSITAAKPASVPPPPRPLSPPAVESVLGLERGGAPTALPKSDSDFNRQGLTGKGVIVGVVDTGIDWTH